MYIDKYTQFLGLDITFTVCSLSIIIYYWISLGSGPCLFCGTMVCTREEQEVLNRGSRKSEILRKKLMGDDGSKGKLKCITIVDSFKIPRMKYF